MTDTIRGTGQGAAESVAENFLAAWNAIAVGYDRECTPTHMDVSREALHHAGLQSGMTFLDVAAGSGALSIPALRLGARVLATDYSSVMLECLAKRAAGEGLSIETRVMDGQALTLQNDKFDIVGSQFGVMLFPDMPRGISEMTRVVRPGGRVLVIALGDPTQVEFFSFFIRAIKVVRPEFDGPPSDDAPLPFQLQDPERLRHELTKAGLKSVGIELTTQHHRFKTGRQMWDWVVSSNPVAETILGRLNLSEGERGGIREALEHLLRERAGGEDSATLKVPINIGIGTK